jgi:hypothetical protein
MNRARRALDDMPLARPLSGALSRRGFPRRNYRLSSLDGKLLGVLGRSGKRQTERGRIRDMAFPAENLLHETEMWNRQEKLVLQG